MSWRYVIQKKTIEDDCRGLEGDGFPVLKRDSRVWATMRHSCSISVTYVTYTMILLVKRPFHRTEAILVVIAHQW